ncbi:plasmid replication protein RepC [Methylocella tundrae]|uniref:Plasmid replication protein C n=1 Tax=Methylocella tundrae TaxID=227605 RepID=A0A4U8Z7I8_METTU|nr:plasmid replication protein RepC [Methylocella tundrae]WPP02726.1 plasmid replication protein RepC [Methylocella tundrae]VFU17452.1 Plasmid replication protein C [Methylocella tundrae]
MQLSLSTTPFGRRLYTLAQTQAQIVAKECAPNALVRKWLIFDDICAAMATLGLSDRTLAVLKALLSFYRPDTLAGDKPIIVFPSNRALAQRAGGMAEKTLRRHLAILVTLGIILRRDSANGKRYARKGEGGEIAEAFGFDLTPIVARAEEFRHLAAEAAAEQLLLRQLRESITIRRRDIDKMIATGSYEGVRADWNGFQKAFMALGGRIARTATVETLEPLAAALESLANEIRDILESHVKTSKMTGNGGQSDRHIQNSNKTPFLESEHGLPISHRATSEPQPETTPPPSLTAEQTTPQKATFPLAMVLDACPDIVEQAPEGIKSWRDLIATAERVRPWIGVSPSAWEEANDVLGPTDAAIVLAAILQRGDAIASAGGYLRSLTQKARAGAFSLGPVLMALIRANLRKRGKKMRA